MERFACKFNGTPYLELWSESEILDFVACEILDFVACEILNFEHCSYLTAHLDSVLRSAKMDISHENFNHY